MRLLLLDDQQHCPSQGRERLFSGPKRVLFGQETGFLRANDSYEINYLGRRLTGSFLACSSDAFPGIVVRSTPQKWVFQSEKPHGKRRRVIWIKSNLYQQLRNTKSCKKKVESDSSILEQKSIEAKICENSIFFGFNRPFLIENKGPVT